MAPGLFSLQNLRKTGGQQTSGRFNAASWASGAHLLALSRASCPARHSWEQMPSFSLEGLQLGEVRPSLSIFSPRSTSSFTNVALATGDRRQAETLPQPQPLPAPLCHTHFMCFTALEPTRSATNSTVRRSDGGWLWKKACSRSTCPTQRRQSGGNPLPRRRRRLTCSFCWDLLGVGASLSSAEVGVIFRMKPPLLAALPDTNAARSLRNSPA